MNSRLHSGKGSSVVLMVCASALAVLSGAPAATGAHLRLLTVVLAVLLALLAVLSRFRSSRVRLFKIQPGQWHDDAGAYEYTIKPGQAAGRSHVLVTMPRPNGGEEEVLADVHQTPAGGIKVRAGTRVRVNIYVD